MLTATSGFTNKQEIQMLYGSGSYHSRETYDEMQKKAQKYENIEFLKTISHLEKLIDLQKHKFKSPISPKVFRRYNFEGIARFIEEQIKNNNKTFNFLYMPIGHYTGIRVEHKDNTLHFFHSDCLDQTYDFCEDIIEAMKLVNSNLNLSLEFKVYTLEENRQIKDGFDCAIFALRDLIILEKENISVASLPIKRKKSDILTNLLINQIALNSMSEKFLKTSQKGHSTKPMNISIDLEKPQTSGSGWTIEVIEPKIVRTDNVNAYTYYLNIKYLAGL